MPGKHNFFSASSAHRWMECTASVIVDTSKLVEESSPAAERGTRLHGVAEAFLNDPERRGFSTLVDQQPDDAAAILPYLEYVDKRIEKGGSDLWAFYEIEDTWRPNCGGTADAVIIEDGKLEVIDLKTGYWPVSPRKNLQLIIYALAVLERFDALYDIDKIKLTIVQAAKEANGASGGKAVESWPLTRKALEGWRKRIEDVITKIEDGDVEFKPSKGTGAGKDWCKFCPAEPICPALQVASQAAARDDFSAVAADGLDVDQVEDLTLAQKMELVPLVRAWAKAIESRVHDKVMAGATDLGYKMVRGNNTARRWEDEQEQAARDFLLANGLKLEEVMTVPTLITAPKAEGVLKKTVPGRGKADKTKRDGLVKGLGEFIKAGQPGNPVMVPDDDKRTAIEAKTAAADDFADDANNAAPDAPDAAKETS